ncbi:MAG: hypothetical protein HXY50_01065 [Ignavibacteriaceae bacterium]|nr:hypothetical protein [Ignavibacteriaceae bacterium]
MNIASIDIGTNTVIMLIAEFDLIQKQIKVILNDQKIPRIGQGLKPGKPISSKKEILLIDILESFKKIAAYHNCEKILVTATNAFRVASNSGSIVKNIKRVLNLDIKIASSEEEARLTYFGCTGGFQLDKTLCVIDIGGGSTEISFGSNNNFN